MLNQTRTVLLVDAREAARLLAVSPRKLWAMTFEDEPGLPHVRLGRLVRYSIDELWRWIDAQKRGGDAQMNATPNTQSQPLDQRDESRDDHIGGNITAGAMLVANLVVAIRTGDHEQVRQTRRQLRQQYHLVMAADMGEQEGQVHAK